MNLQFRDLTENDIEVRLDQIKPTYCTLLLYKNSRVDMNLLDEAVGSMNWQRRHSRDNKNCEIGIYDSDKKEWVWKEDTGTESYAEAEKGLASDSFKRAGTNWGIGRELYTKLNIRVNCRTEENEKKKLVVKDLCNFEVEKIEIKNKTIIGLVISAYNKDSKKNETIFTYGTLKSKEPKNDSEQQSKAMTLESARAMEVDIGENKYKLGDLSTKQLLKYKIQLADNPAYKDYYDAICLILTDTARTGDIKDDEGQNN